MAMVETGSNGISGIRFLVAAGYVYEVVAAACSSPQTMELNSVRRGPTLMKWVNIGMVQAVFFVGVAAWLDKAHMWEYIAGAALAMAALYAQYMYAKNAGLSMGLGTEG